MPEATRDRKARLVGDLRRDVLTMALFWRGQPQGVIVHTDSWTIAVLRVKFIFKNCIIY